MLSDKHSTTGMPRSWIGRVVVNAARRVQDILEVVIDAILWIGGFGLAALMYLLMLVMALGALYVLVRFVKWAWTD